MPDIRNYWDYAGCTLDGLQKVDRASSMGSRSVKTNLNDTDRLQIISYLLDSTKVFTIGPGLKQVLMTTKNQLYERRMPFSTMFLDIEMTNPKLNQKINGIWFFDTSQLDPDMAERRIRIIVKDTITFMHHVIPFPIYDDLKEWLAGLDLTNPIDKITYQTRHFLKKVQMVVINFLDFMNNPEVDVRYSKPDKKKNEKRIKRGKPALPSLGFIKLSGHLKRYVGEMEESGSRSQASYRFDVRGHYVHFWNKERYQRLFPTSG